MEVKNKMSLLINKNILNSFLINQNLYCLIIFIMFFCGIKISYNLHQLFNWQSSISLFINFNQSKLKLFIIHFKIYKALSILSFFLLKINISNKYQNDQ